MNIVLYAAVTADGFIAREDSSTDWVKDDELFEKTCREFGCVAMGHNTYKEFGKPPFEGIQYLVLAKNAGIDVNYKGVIYVSGPERAIQKAKDLGFDKLLVIGGGQCNGSFAKAGLLNEVWLDEHPLKLGSGIKLLGNYPGKLDLKQVSSKELKDFVHFRYKI